MAVSRQVAVGLGTFPTPTGRLHGSTYEKAGYISQFLYVLTIGLAKVTAFLFALKLDAKRQLPWLTNTGILGTGIWFL